MVLLEIILRVAASTKLEVNLAMMDLKNLGPFYHIKEYMNFMFEMK